MKATKQNVKSNPVVTLHQATKESHKEPKAKKITNNISFDLVKENNKSFTVKSLFRVLDHINNDEEFLKALQDNGLKGLVTIDLLKELCPEYTALKYDKKGKVKTKLFRPWVFGMALRNHFGQVK